MYAPVVVINSRDESIDLVFDGDGVTLNGIECYFDGCGVVDGVFIRDASDLVGLNDFSSLYIDRVYRECSGSFCLYLKEGNSLWIYPDPLGACLVYRYRNSDFVAYSTDLGALFSYLHGRAEDVYPDPFYMALLVKIGNGAYGWSSYKNIRVLDACTYVSVRGHHVEEKSYFSVVDEVLSAESYEGYRDLAIEDLYRNLEAVKSAGIRNIIGHLTGGFDTRLVAASVEKLGLGKDVSFFCSGPATMPDKQIAYGVASKFDWPLTNFNGLMGGGSDQYGSYFAGLKYSSGMMASSAVNEEHQRNRDFLILSGGYGECYRSFYSKGAHKGCDNLWGKKNIVGEEVNDRIEEMTSRYVKGNERKGFSLAQALDLMYPEQRNRYFVGNIATLFSRKTPRFDPLYSINAIIAGLCLPADMRQDNFLGYQVLKEVDERFLRFEFDEKKFGDSVYNLEPELGVEKVNDDFHEKREFRYSDHIRRGEDPQRKVMSRDVIELAKKIKAAPWQVASYDTVREECKALLHDRQLRGYLGEVVDVGYTTNLCRRPVPRNRVELRDLYSIYSFMTFLAESMKSASPGV